MVTARSRGELEVPNVQKLHFNDVFFLAVQENVAFPSSTCHMQLGLLEMYLTWSGFTRILDIWRVKLILEFMCPILPFFWVTHYCFQPIYEIYE